MAKTTPRSIVVNLTARQIEPYVATARNTREAQDTLNRQAHEAIENVVIHGNFDSIYQDWSLEMIRRYRPTYRALTDVGVNRLIRDVLKEAQHSLNTRPATRIEFVVR